MNATNPKKPRDERTPIYVYSTIDWVMRWLSHLLLDIVKELHMTDTY